MDRKVKFKKAIHVILLIGALITLSSFFLSWTTATRSPASHLFVTAFQYPPDLLVGILGPIIFYPHLILGILVIVGLYLKFKRGIYWIALVESIWTPVVTRQLLKSGIITASVLSAFRVDPKIALGGYAAISGPIITLIGLILYKLVGRK